MNWKRKSERLSDGWLRTAKRQVQRICTGLANSPDEDLLKATHDVRKRIKKLRALLRLTRDRIDGPFRRKQNQSLRQISHSLSPMRDATAQVAIWEKLHQHFPEDISAEVFTAVARELSAQEEPSVATAASRKQLQKKLQSALKSVKKLPLKKLRKKDLRAGIKRTGRLFREGFKLARKSATDENLHNWRKRAKDLVNQLDILGQTLSVRDSKRVEQLEKLGRLLGDDHDLMILENRLRELDAGSHQKLQRPILTWRKQLQKTAFKLGRKI
jgi:CHAD domain-containing protein